MKRLFCLVMGLMFLLAAGCSKSATGDEKTAADYVKSQGYEITDRKGEIEHYILEKSKLWGSEARPYQQAWGVQTVEPDGYFGKEISVYGFTVKNHPLEQTYKQSDGTNVYIMLSDGQVIGGYSFPNADVLGGVHSLDGKTLEEVTGLSLQQWAQKWKERYGQSWTGDIVLNDAEALEKASAHADQKYASMKSKNMKILNKGMVDRGDHKEYWYFWREEKDGILTPNFVSIVLNPYCGEIASYNCRDIGDISIPKVNLSKDEAIAIAKEKHPDARSIKADLDMWLTREGAPLLRWTVAVSLPNRADGTPYGLTYMINAETGEVYEVTGY